MINKDIIDAFKAVAKAKNIDRTNLSSIIENLFTNIIKRKYGEDYSNFNVIVNMEKGEIEIYQHKTVVKEVGDSITEISLEEARKVEGGLELGDMYIDVIDPQKFGRRLINNAKQFFSQSLKDIEKQTIYDEYSSKIGNIIIGNVHQIQKDRIFVICDDKELILPKNEQMPNDRYRRGESLRAVVKKVDITSRGPEVIISRSDNQFLEKLFALEVPEIDDDIIEIKTVSRCPGDRSKIIVYSSDKRIDAVGACVGMKGMRIQSIVRELNGEKIDIINWSEQPEILITRSLSPARPLDLYIDEERSYAVAVFEDEDLAIAIGRNGQNIKLVSKITGFTVDAISKTDYQEQEDGAGENKTMDKASPFGALPDKISKILIENGINTIEEARENHEKIVELKGIGPKAIEKITEHISENEQA